MYKFDIITIFPEVLEAYFKSSILGRAQKSPPPLADKSSIPGRKAQSAKGGGKIQIRVHNLRDSTKDKHLKVDDRPYGGGPGMVFKIEPMARAIGSILKLKVKSEKLKIILFSPLGKQFDVRMAANFAKKYDHIVIIAGHYEGVDERIKKVVSDFGFRISDLSIGPYTLTGGEIPAMALVDAVSRQIPGVLGKAESLEEKRFGVGVPAYTRPEVFLWRGKKYSVPKVLLSGDHKKIEEWRRKNQSY